MKIQGIKNMPLSQLSFEVQSGAKFVQYCYCISVIIVTLRRGTDIYFVKSGENRIVRGLVWTLLSLLLGWWGIPWGPIYTVQSIYRNFSGGIDHTAAVMHAIAGNASASAAG